MNGLASAKRWCQEHPNNSISTKLRRHATSIIALFTVTILAASFFLFYMPYVVTHPDIQSIPIQPEPTTSSSTESNATRKQPLAPAYQQPLSPGYASYSPLSQEQPQWNIVVINQTETGGSGTVVMISWTGIENPPPPMLWNFTGNLTDNLIGSLTLIASNMNQSSGQRQR